MFNSFTLQQVLCIIFGLLSFVTNVFLVAVIRRCKELHFNAYYLAAALSIAEIINAVAFVSSGISSLLITYKNESDTLVTPWKCLQYPHVILFPVGYHSGAMMMLLIACDRLLSMTALKWYYQLGWKYTASLIGLCCAYSASIVAYFTYDTIFVVPEEPGVNSLCWSTQTETVHDYDYYAVLVFVTVAVLIMIAAQLILRKRSTTQGQAQTSRAIERNAKAVRVLVMITFNSFCTWVVPEIFMSILNKYDESFTWSIAPYLWLLQPAHSVINLVIYFRTGGQFRHAYRAMKNTAASQSGGGAGTRSTPANPLRMQIRRW